MGPPDLLFFLSKVVVLKEVAVLKEEGVSEVGEGLVWPEVHAGVRKEAGPEVSWEVLVVKSWLWVHPVMKCQQIQVLQNLPGW